MALHTQPARGTRLACRASPGSGQAFRLSVSVPTHQPAPGPSAPQIAGVAAMGLAVAFVLKKLSKKMGPADRIWVEGQQKGTREYSFVRDVMKNVNTTSMPSLSEEQIVAARTRRLMDRGDEKFTNLEDIELPENHPWAVRAPGKLLPGTVDRESVRAPLPKRRGKPPVSPQFLEEDDDVPQAPMKSRNPAARGEGQGARDSQWQQRNARE